MEGHGRGIPPPGGTRCGRRSARERRGNFLFAYELFSRLTDRPLHVPLQHHLVDGHRVVGFGDRSFFARQLAALGAVRTDADAARFLDGYPIHPLVDVLPKTTSTVRAFERFFTMLDRAAQREDGLTEPLPSLVADIEPNPDGVLFTGPLVALVDG